MKAVLFFILVLCAYSGEAQSDWHILPNAPVITDGRFDDIYFVNDSTGWGVNGNGKIYKTENFGESWVLQFDTLNYFRSIEFINDSVGFAGTLRKAVYRTSNRGKSWRRIDQHFSQEIPGVCGISHDGNNITMVGLWNSPAYILRSSDSGLTWNCQDMSSVAKSLVDCWYKSKDTVFVSGKSVVNDAGLILRSVDGGINWHPVTPQDVPAGIVWKLQFVTNKIGYASLYQAAGTETSILKTIDGGATYTKMKALSRNIDVEGIGFINPLKGWIGGWSSGMYETTDGGLHWKFVNITKNINRYYVIREDLVYAAGETIYVYKPIQKDEITTELSTIPENNFLHTLEIYPNPTSQNTHVNVHIKKPTMAVISLCDITGKSIREIFNGHLEAGLFKYELDFANLGSGEFFIVLQTDEHSVNKKLILAKSH